MCCSVLSECCNVRHISTLPWHLSRGRSSGNLHTMCNLSAAYPVPLRRVHAYRCICIYMYIHLYAMCRPRTLGRCTECAVACAQYIETALNTMGWLRLVGSLKSYVSFAKEPYKRDDILQKRPTILRSLLIEATPYHRSEGHCTDTTTLGYALDAVSLESMIAFNAVCLCTVHAFGGAAQSTRPANCV